MAQSLNNEGWYANTVAKMKRFSLAVIALLVLAPACTSAPALTPASPTVAPTPMLPTSTPVSPTPLLPTVTPAMLPSTTAPVTPTPTPLACTFRDDFDGTTLNPVWSWVREDKTHWSLSAKPGNLRIVTRSKEAILGKSNSQSNLLLQKAPSGNFEIITKVTFQPSIDYQQAALLVYQDDDNFITLGNIHASLGGGTGIDFESEVAGKSTLGYEIRNGWTRFSASPVYLKIVKDGTHYRGYFSSDKSPWISSGEYTLENLANLKVGISATNGSNEPDHEIPADFDYFCVVASP